MLVPVIAAFVIAVTLTPVIAAWARRRNLLDIPNHRSSHTVATPRTGGLALLLAVLAGLTLSRVIGGLAPDALLLAGGALCIAVAGFVDDIRSLPAAGRLLFQLVVAAAVVVALGRLAIPVRVDDRVIVGLTVIWITALINAYNFMDGIDGLAGGHAVVDGLGWAIIGTIVGSNGLIVIGSLVAAAAAGFLVHNWPPAKVFMGDAGSSFLGFIFGAMPLLVGGADTRAVHWAVLLTWPLLFDTGFTLVRRIRRRENILLAHRSHLYQRLTATGVSHARVSLLYSGLAAIGASGAIAIAMRWPGATAVSYIAITVSACGLWLYVGARESTAVRPRSTA